MSDDELYLVDDEIADAKARELSSRIVAGDGADEMFAEILQSTGSRSYAVEIAARATYLVTLYVLNEMPVSVVPAVSGRLQKFVKWAAMSIAMHQWRESSREADG